MLFEEKLVAKLGQIGMSRGEAGILLYLFKANSGLARDVERGADLRQPELSAAANKLLERGWIKSTTIKSKGKGRPQLKYFLGNKEIIIKAINKLFMAKIHSLEDDMKDFNELMKGIKCIEVRKED